MYPDSGSARYLIDLAREAILRVYFERGNAPLEFSALRSRLEQGGLGAKHDNHWGLLAMHLARERILVAVGREAAAVASRHNAKNGVYCLSPGWWKVAEQYAGIRGWCALPTVAPAVPATPAAQESLAL